MLPALKFLSPLVRLEETALPQEKRALCSPSRLSEEEQVQTTALRQSA